MRRSPVLALAVLVVGACQFTEPEPMGAGQPTGDTSGMQAPAGDRVGLAPPGKQLTSVIPGQRGCEPDGCMNYEWIIGDDRSLRLTASGYEDGIDYDLYRISDDGRYTHLLAVNPVIRDASRGGGLFWGYPWDVRDITVSGHGHGMSLLASFEHDIVRDGNTHTPGWQQQVPALLLEGETTQPQMRVEPIDFQPMSVPDLVDGARADRRHRSVAGTGAPARQR